MADQHGNGEDELYPDDREDESLRFPPQATIDKLINEAISKFPAEFGLRAYPGKTFTISKAASLWDCGDLYGQPHHAPGPLLYVYIKADDPMVLAGRRDGPQWMSFCKNRPEEITREIVIRKETLINYTPMHLSVTEDGLASLWDNEFLARGASGEAYVAIELTDIQRTQIEIARMSLKKR